MSLKSTFVLEFAGLRDRITGNRLYPCGSLDPVIAAQPEADRLPTVDVLSAWKDYRRRAYPYDWTRATWPTLADAQTYAAYLAVKADMNPERTEEARLFAAFVEALPAAWDYESGDDTQ